LDESQPEKRRSFARWLRRKIGLERSREEIQQVLDESEERGLISPEEGEMIEGIFELKETVAREIMIPRTHIVALPKDASKEQVLTAIIQSGYSRIPVYDENVDQIIGILNAKDLLPYWLKNADELPIAEICRVPYFVPETKPIKDLLNELREKKSHLAVIVDEYGGTSGIVTIEDIVEEIIGEIRDEHDTEEDQFIRQEDGSVLVSPRCNLYDFEEQFQVEFPKGGYDTLGGFIIHFLGRVPKPGEHIAVQGLKFFIHGADQKRITRIVVSSVSEQEETVPRQPEPVP
jgi:CBS domain containing-hemolysin-like protein